MKNLLVHISPSKEFCNDEHKMAAKIQIDNSLRLGWKVEDIILVTNFDYEYGGIKSVVVGDDNYCEHSWPATKVYVIDYLFKNGFIEDDLYWYHDFDCFELNKIIEEDVLKELGVAEMGLTNYGRMPRLCSASMFFKKTVGDIFSRLREEIDKYEDNEEICIMRLINEDTGDLKTRVKKINITYAFHKFNIINSDKEADKPIRAAHFHLTPDKYDFYVRGNNKLGIILVPERLRKIFHEHGFKG